MPKFLLKKQAPRSSGFTLIFAMLIGGIVLAIGLGIFNIVYRELKLSSLTRDSDAAFYAADAGAECALYWEFKDTFTPEEVTPVDIRCSEQTIAGIVPDVGAATTTWAFTIPVGHVSSSQESCAVVSVAKNNTSSKMSIESSGRNEGGASCTAGSRTVERTLRINFR